MKDFNFFEPYLHIAKKKTKEAKKKSPVKLILKVIALIVIIGSPIFVFGSIFLANKAIDEMNEIINSPEMQEALTRVDQKRVYASELQTLQKDLIQIHKKLLESDIIRKEHLLAVLSSIPENVNIDMVDLSSEECTISGSAYSRDAIAEFEYNLRKSKRFEGLLLENITGNTDPFTFNIQFSLIKVVD